MSSDTSNALQAEADIIIPEAKRGGTICLSDEPHTKVCGQQTHPGKKKRSG